MILKWLFSRLDFDFPPPPQCRDEIWLLTSLFHLEREFLPSNCPGEDLDKY